MGHGQNKNLTRWFLSFQVVLITPMFVRLVLIQKGAETGWLTAEQKLSARPITAEQAQNDITSTTRRYSHPKCFVFCAVWGRWVVAAIFVWVSGPVLFTVMWCHHFWFRKNPENVNTLQRNAPCDCLTDTHTHRAGSFQLPQDCRPIIPCSSRFSWTCLWPHDTRSVDGASDLKIQDSVVQCFHDDASL